MSKSDETLDPEKLLAAAGDDGDDRSSSSPPSSRDDDDDDGEDEDEEDSEPPAKSAKPASEPPKSAKPAATAAPVMAHAVAGHGHAHGDEAHGDDHGLSHITPLSLLVGVLSALIVLTIVTVYTAGIDLGHQWNLVVAMVIATVKASLVVTYFMHLRWDKKLHLLVFLSSVLFLILFLAMALTDRKEYQHSIDEVDRAAQQK